MTPALDWQSLIGIVVSCLALSVIPVLLEMVRDLNHCIPPYSEESEEEITRRRNREAAVIMLIVGTM